MLIRPAVHPSTVPPGPPLCSLLRSCAAVVPAMQTHTSTPCIFIEHGLSTSCCTTAARTCVGVLSAPPSPMYPVSSRRTSYTTPLSPVPLVEASLGFADDIAFRAVQGARRSGQKKHSTSDRVQARQCCKSSVVCCRYGGRKSFDMEAADGELLPAFEATSTTLPVSCAADPHLHNLLATRSFEGCCGKTVSR